MTFSEYLCAGGGEIDTMNIITPKCRSIAVVLFYEELKIGGDRIIFNKGICCEP